MEEARRGKKRGKREPLWKNGREKESVGKGMEKTKWVKKNGERRQQRDVVAGQPTPPVSKRG